MSWIKFVVNTMFRHSIEGLENILYDEIPKGSVVLVIGAEGTLKSSLVFSMITNHLIASQEDALYATLEETEESLIRNIDSIGIKKVDRLHIFDYKDMRMEWMKEDPELISVTEDVIEYYINKYDDLSIFALDSLNVLYTLFGADDMRKSMYSFFNILRDKGLTSFLITESAPSGGLVYAGNYQSFPERFLADGIIEVGVMESNDAAKRYIQIKKMRATKHAMNKHHLIVGEGGLSILGSVY
jgi:KaiC/GvpD/RAD55 family RecA-like ATPase